MKRISLLGLLIFVLLSACGSPKGGAPITPKPILTNTYTSAPTSSPTPPETPTPKPTTTPEPTPTATERPFTPVVGMENVTAMSDCNQMTIDQLDSRMPAIDAASLAQYKTLGLIDTDGNATMIAFANVSDGIESDGRFPWYFARLSLLVDPKAMLCEVITMPDGSQVLAITVPMRAKGTNNLIPITFSVEKDIENIFADIQAKTAQGKPFGLGVTPWILSSGAENPGLVEQWKASSVLLEKFNWQDDAAIAKSTTPMTADQIPLVKTSLLMQFFISPFLTDKPIDVQNAIIRELSDRHAVFPAMRAWTITPH